MRTISRRLGAAGLGALIGAVFVFAVFFVTSFFVNVAALHISGAIQWVVWLVAVMSGFVIGLLWE